MSELQGQLGLPTGLVIWEGFELMLSEQTLRFHAGVNDLSGPVVWQGQTYTPWPLQGSDFGVAGSGAPARPKLVIGNFGGLVSALCRQYDNLLGRKLIRRRTLAKFLDAVNFVKTNYLLWSEDGTQSTWVRGNASVAKAGLSASGSQFTALVETAATSVHTVRQIVTSGIEAGATYRASVVCKALPTGGARQLHLRVRDQSVPIDNVVVELSSGAQTNARTSARSVESLGGGEYRISLTFTAPPAATELNFELYLWNGPSLSYAGDGVSGALVTQMQLSKGPAQMPYQKTGASWNPLANAAEEYPPETWYITRKVNETPAVVEFELGSPLDVQGVRLPRRQAIAGTCLWQYRSAECGYAGPAIADAFDQPTSDPARDQCSRTLSGCRCRFGSAELPFGGFPGLSKAPRLT